MLLVLVFSMNMGAIEDCSVLFGELKMGSESSVDQVFEWVVHVLWRCEYFSVGGMEATFSRSGMAIGEGATPVLVWGLIVS